MKTRQPIPRYVEILKVMFDLGADKKYVKTKEINRFVQTHPRNLHNNLRNLLNHGVLNSRKRGYERGWAIVKRQAEHYRNFVSKYYGASK